MFIAAVVFTLVASVRLRGEEEPKFYDPVERDIEGWTIVLDPQLLSAEHKAAGDKALTALANHLQRVKYIVPEDRVARLQKCRIWIDRHHPKLSNMQYHPDRGWLVANRHDPRLVKHVHIPRAEQLVDRRTWAKHPYVVLHELAHAYHDQVLGFDRSEIVDAYKSAREKGIYDSVLLFTGKKVRHYALSNHKEYFAESTEAYFGMNDFYPFVRAELKAHDPTMFALMEKFWGRIP
jgi:dipeptidyl-peptidase-4